MRKAEAGVVPMSLSYTIHRLIQTNAHLVKYSAIIRVESSVVKKQAFLYYTLSASCSNLSQTGLLRTCILHTPLEAIDRCRNLHSSCEKIRQSRKCYRKENSKCGCAGEKRSLRMVIVDLLDRVHIEFIGRIIVGASLLGGRSGRREVSSPL